MRKIFILAIGFLIAEISPALAVNTCLNFNADSVTSCSASAYGGADWQGTCQVSGYGSVPVTGIAICGDDGGVTTVIGDVRDKVYYEDDTSVCWCKMVSPAVSKYVHISTSDCRATCASRCAALFASSGGKRVFFSNIELF